MIVHFSYCKTADKSVALPARQTMGSAGFDIRANLIVDDRKTGIKLSKGASVAIPTGIRLSLPKDVVCDIRSRSGLAKVSSVVVLNSPGTIDPDFRGEVTVLLINHGDSDYIVQHGKRIAQLVFLRFVSPNLTEVDELSVTKRGQKGFGSTAFD